MGAKGFQNTIFAILFIIVGIISSIFIIGIPSKQESSQVASSGIAREFNVETFEGWVFTLDTLKREQEILYAPEPNPESKNEEEQMRAKTASRRLYPKQYLPSLIEEYGIAVQKKYSGNFLFQAQKTKMQEFLNKELILLSEGMTLFRPSSDPINANDAVVLKALEKYTILLEHLNTKINDVTYQDAHNHSIGELLLVDMEEKDFSDPLAYGMIAIEHLENNIRAHQATYFSLGETDKEQTPNLKQVADILGIELGSGQAVN